MVVREQAKCPKCGGDYDAIHNQYTANFIGDTFIMWNAAGHVCKVVDPPPSNEDIKNLQESSKKAKDIVSDDADFKSLFANWELAKRLKAVGFSDKCFAYYWKDKDTFHYTVQHKDHNSSAGDLRVSAPLIQQIIDWLDKQKIFIDIDHEFGEDWEFCVDNGGTGHSGDDTIYASRSEATLEAINAALKHLETPPKKKSKKIPK